MTMNRGRLRKWQWMSALWLLLLASSLPAANTEADVKAAFIYNFTKFVEWPLTALADNTPLQLCILGQDDTSNRLRQLHGREAQGRSLQIRQLTAPNEAAGCHVLFITRHASRQLKEDHTLLSGSTPRLTVSDAPGFIQQGGTIELFVEANRVQFMVNVDTAQLANLKISARMLQLARTPKQVVK